MRLRTTSHQSGSFSNLRWTFRHDDDFDDLLRISSLNKGRKFFRNPSEPRGF